MAALAITFYFAFVRGSAIAAIVFGISKSLMVIQSTHACSHYSFSIYPKLNRFVYWLNMSIAGDTPAQWTAKHVIAHHIDTNITPEDDDTMYPLKRVLPGLPRCWWHSYQHLYIWILYFFVFLPWTVSHNIKVIFGLIYGKMFEGVAELLLIRRDIICKNLDLFVCLLKLQCLENQVRHNGAFDWTETLSCIMIHHITRLAPFFFVDTWFGAIFVVLMTELSSSMWFSLQFAVNHEIAEATLFSDLSTKVHSQNRDWGEHQLLTSHNYSIDFSPSLYLSGGLNYQIEHHLFPSIHYKYYPDLSKIVQQTAKEFNLPYNSSVTFLEGIGRHYQLLKEMGSKD
ncbi:hypothetical protein RFI_17589 [Reticulomyxa filosa]|uniref:Fatty acid desaturase domain-containing protein n=1 Tax=Reticulomyxa filosa TaxID=46433 RepID=X6N2U5_RETFI|nr:hypothetical protein RFI_17589 [Reticulomyxa filosa]|eukprot:ETO19642.1 hypothetical protein RFI_17589 [Reticulomyxa filosa]